MTESARSGTIFNAKTEALVTDGAAHVNPSHQGGEESVSSTVNSKLRTTKDWKRFRMAAGEGEQLVYAGECRIGGVIFDGDYAAANADNIVTLYDEAATGVQTASNKIKVTFAGDTTAPHDSDMTVEGIRCANGLTAELSGTSADNSEKITILYREAELT